MSQKKLNDDSLRRKDLESSCGFRRKANRDRLQPKSGFHGGGGKEKKIKDKKTKRMSILVGQKMCEAVRKCVYAMSKHMRHSWRHGDTLRC